MSITNPKNIVKAEAKKEIKPGPVVQKAEVKAEAELAKAEIAKPASVQLFEFDDSIQVNADTGMNLRHCNFETLLLAGATKENLLSKIIEVTEMKGIFNKLQARDLVKLCLPVNSVNYMTKRYVVCVHHSWLPLTVTDMGNIQATVAEYCVFNIKSFGTFSTVIDNDAIYVNCGVYESPKPKAETKEEK